MLETIVQGKLMMIPLMLCSVMALAVFFDRAWAFYQYSKIDTPALRAKLKKLIARGNVEDAALLCANTPGGISLNFSHCFRK